MRCLDRDSLGISVRVTLPMRKANVAALDTLADTQIVEQCLQKIEARCHKTLKCRQGSKDSGSLPVRYD